jgi:aryl-alcohol dehydrogenase-like predicted oxidoreductase
MPDPLQPQRRLGTTGVTVPLIGYGTAPLGKSQVSRSDAARCLNRALDLGITYLDTSPDYGSEPHVGEVMRTRRQEAFLATKVNKRSYDGALEELLASLERLQTDHVDLIQVHAVNTWGDLEQALAPDGVVAGLEEARKNGLVRFIGITGHARPEILAHALAEYPFDTVLAPLGMADHLVANPERFLIPEAEKHSTAVIAMKVYAHGCHRRRDLALYYSLGMSGVSLAILGLNTVDHVDEAVELAQAYRHIDEDERQLLIDEARQLIEEDAEAQDKGKGKLFWLHDTTVLGWRERDAPVLVDY